MIYSVKDGYSKKELQILMWVHELSYSQGFYGRLEEQLKENREALKHLAKQNFKDILDMVFYLEC